MEGLPLRDYEILHDSHLTHVREVVGQVFVPYELGLVRPDAGFDAWLRWRRLVHTAVSVGGYGAEARVEARPIRMLFAVVAPWSGTAELRCGGARLALTPSEACVLSPGVDMSLHLSKNAVVLAYQIKQSALEARLATLLGESLREPLRFEPATFVHPGEISIGTRLRALVHSIDRDRGVVDNPRAAHAYEQELMTRLLFEQPHNYSAMLRAFRRPVGSRTVRQAVALLESHPEWRHSVESMARALSVSHRSMQRRFRDELGETFEGILRGIRLQCVHDDLLRSAPGVTIVDEVISRWGLPLSGHTSRAYHERYGETPSETLHRFD